MKKLFILFAAIVYVTYSAFAQLADPSEKIALDYLNAIKTADYSRIESLQDSTMNQMFSGKNLKDFIEKLKSQVGEIKEISKPKLFSDKINKTFIIPIKFAAMELDGKVVVSAKNNKVAGFFLVPHESSISYKYPEYADTSKFYEKECRVGEKGWELPATLTIPRSKVPVPVVILVHGSGPHDRDETIGPNKVFKDIAAGLATKGIAVLRYEKRTKHYGAKIAADYLNFTLDDETVNDAVEAVKYLKLRQEIDKNKIFVIGHSLGGYAAPRIGNLSPDLAGIILMAGSNRPLYELVLEQMDYLVGLDGEVSKEDKESLALERRKVDNLLQKDLKNDYPADSLPLNMPAKYWKSLLNYDPIQEIKKFSKTILILQGERDYQVTMKDYDNWQTALQGNTKVSYRTYNKLNHLFMPGKGPANPKEYDVEGHVDKQVIDDIFTFIKFQ